MCGCENVDEPASTSWIDCWYERKPENPTMNHLVDAHCTATDLSSRITCLSSNVAIPASSPRATAAAFLPRSLLEDEEEEWEPEAEAAAGDEFTDRCVGPRWLVDGCKRGSVSCSAYASEWTKTCVSRCCCGCGCCRCCPWTWWRPGWPA